MRKMTRPLPKESTREPSWRASVTPRRGTSTSSSVPGGLYGPTPLGNNFVDTMLRLGSQRPELRVVDDQYCTPTYVVHLARALRFLLGTSAFGIYHIVNAGSTTWYRFAQEIFRYLGKEVILRPITSQEYGARHRGRPIASWIPRSIIPCRGR